jgi:hypothetical protein
MNRDEGFENEARDEIIRELRENLARCRRVLSDEKLDLKTHERWTQLYNNTSTVLNQILKDRQMRDWENRLREIEEHEKEIESTKGTGGIEKKGDASKESTERSENPQSSQSERE